MKTSLLLMALVYLVAALAAAFAGGMVATAAVVLATVSGMGAGVSMVVPSIDGSDQGRNVR